MTVRDEETRIVELLIPLQRIEPVPLRHRHGEQQRRPVLLAAVVAAALVVTGVAIAARIGAFDGIGSAQHPQRPADIIDRQTKIFLQHLAPALLFDTSRVVGKLPSGRRVWVISNARGDLCVVVERAVDACGPSLSDAQPTTISTWGGNRPGQPTVSFGVARDGVTAISFMAQGREVTVRVKHNVWAYEGDSAVQASATVHYADGRTATLTNGTTTQWHWQPASSSLRAQCSSTARTVGYAVPCLREVPQSVRRGAPQEGSSCGTDLVAAAGYGGFCPRIWRGWVLGSGSVGADLLAITASPKPLSSYAHLVDGPLWVSQTDRVRFLGRKQINGLRMAMVYVLEGQNTHGAFMNAGSAFMGHVALIWTTGGHTYGVGVRAPSGVARSIELATALAQRIVLVNPRR